MSDGTGQAIFAIAGQVIGTAIGGPIGGQIGSMIGSAIGGMIWKQDGGSQTGPRLSDRAVQGSAYGTVMPKVYGAYRLAGNIIWCKTGGVQEVATVKRVGKSLFSKGTKTTTYAYFGHFATALCDGPVSGFGRVWADGKLIYDPLAEGKYDSYLRFYTGSETQLPDPDIQADRGVDSTPAFRGTAYVVFHGLPLVDFGNRLPIIHVEIGGIAIAEATRDGALSNVATYNWTYDPAQPTKAVNTYADYVTVVNTTTMTAVQFQPSLDAGVLAAMTAEFGGTYGPTVTSTQYTRAFLDAASGDVIVFLQGATGKAGMCRFSLSTGTPVLVYAKAKALLGTGVGTAFKFGTKIWMADQTSRYTYCFDIATGDTVWTKGLAADVPEASDTTGGIILHATHRSVLDLVDGEVNGSVYFTVYKSGDNSKCGVVRQYLTTGSIADKVFSFLPVAGEHAITYDTATDSLISICATQFTRLSPTTLDTSATYPHVEAWSSGGFSSSMVDNFGADNTVDGTFYLQHNGSTIYQYETAGLTLLWTGVVPNTAGSLGDLGNPFPTADAGRAFFGHQSGTSYYQFGSTGAQTDLATIIQDLCDKCDLPSDAVDVTGLGAKVITGYCVSRESTGRTALEPLLSAFAVDAPERDGKIVFQYRKTTPDATISADALGATASGDSPPVMKEMRRQEVELPLSVVVKYASQALDYQSATQQTRRVWEAVESGDDMTVEVPVVMTHQDAKTLSSRLLYLSWIERTSYSFSLPPSSLLFDPGDVLTIPVDSTTAATVLLTKVEIGADGVVKCEARATDAIAYLPPSEAPIVPVIPAQSVPKVQTMALEVLDIPLLDDADDTFGAYLAAYGTDADWLGGEVWVSKDGTTYSYAASIPAPAHTGATTTALPGHTGALVDTTNTVRVVFPYAVSLESITTLELLAGGNRAMLGSELIGFATATQIGPATWDLSNLLRCQQGTEWANDHASGARFVLLEDAVAFEAPLSGLNQTWYYKAMPYGQSLDDVTAQTKALAGIRIKPLSPVHLAGTRDGSNNLTLTWNYRARVNADWVDGYETPVDETTEAYEVDIMDGVTVLRTISASSATAPYSSADQVTDGLTPGAPVTVNIYQLSSRVGRGYAGSATV